MRACWSGRQSSLLLWVDRTHIWSRWGHFPGTPWSWLCVFWILDPDYLLFFLILDPDYVLFFWILDPGVLFFKEKKGFFWARFTWCPVGFHLLPPNFQLCTFQCSRSHCLWRRRITFCVDQSWIIPCPSLNFLFITNFPEFLGGILAELMLLRRPLACLCELGKP